MEKNKKPSADIARLNFLIFFTTLAVIGFLFFVLPKPTYSAYEKRELAVIPKFSTEMLISGKYTRGIEAYYSDVFPLRDKLVQITATLENMRGVRGKDDIKVYN